MTKSGYSMTEHFLCAQLLSYARAVPRQPERAETAFIDARAKGIMVNSHVLRAFRRAVGAAWCNQLTTAEDTWPKQVLQMQNHQLQQQVQGMQHSAERKGIQSAKAISTATVYVKAGAH